MKPSWRSKTLWFNIFTGLVMLAEILPPDVGAVVLAVGNLGLRFITKEAISLM